MFTEMAHFEDVDQFVPGRTQFACGYFAARQVWASVPAGQGLTKSPGDITALALADYARFDGDNGPSNEEGMSLQQLYDELKQLGLLYRSVPVDSQSVAHIRGYLALRWPVIVALAESSVLDKQLGACPYPWPPRFNHIITLTGQGPQALEVLVRDTANVDSRWVLRAGPRLYDMSVMAFVSITAVHMPYSIDGPVDSHPIANPVLPTLSPNQDDLQVWRIVNATIPFIPEHAIPQSWLRARWGKGLNFGPPFENEHLVTRLDIPYMEQQFSGARASWDARTPGQVTWWTPGGAVVV